MGDDVQEPSGFHKMILQSDELYSALGRFVVGFEHLCWRMNWLMYKVLKFGGGLRNQQFFNALSTGDTAEPTLRKLRSLWAEAVKMEIGAMPQDDVFASIQKLIETRNDFIHGLWFTGFLNGEDDYSIAHGYKQKNTKRGGVVREFALSKEDFNSLSIEARLIEGKLVGMAESIAHQDDEVPLDDVFSTLPLGGRKKTNG